MSRTAFSAGSFLLMDFCLIFVPFGHYDEPEILPYENPSICPIGADVRHAMPLPDLGHDLLLLLFVEGHKSPPYQLVRKPPATSVDGLERITIGVSLI